MSIEVEKRSRAILRRMFSKTLGELQAKLDAREDGDHEQIQAYMDILDLRYNELQGKNAMIYEYMLNDDTLPERDLDLEIEKAEEYMLKYFKIKRAVAKINEDEVRSVRSTTSLGTVSNINATSCAYKLPQLKLKEFGGDLKDWLPFWSQFKKIDSDTNMDPSDKLQYLVMATVPNSVAREVVESYPSTAEMYPEVIKALKDRFGRDDLLTEFYIRELLKIILQNTISSKKMPLSVLYDKLQCHLRNLHTLGVTSEKCGPILFPLVSSCLPEDVLKVWERNSTLYSQRINNPESSSKDVLDNLIQFLRAEVEGEQKVSLAMSGFGLSAPSNSKASGKHRETKQSAYVTQDIPTASGLVTTTKEKFGCIFCSSYHRAQDCVKAQNMTVTERRRIVDSRKACFCCLKPGHTAKKCKNRPKCIVCGRSHFAIVCDTLSHMLDNSKEGKVGSVPCKPQNDEALASLSNSCNVQMQTLLVNVKGENNTRRVRALIDTASQRSYILSTTATEMAYQPCDKEVIQHSLFGGGSTGIVTHNVYTVYLSHIEGEYGCHFQALDQERICGNISPVKQGPWIDELASHNISLSDLGSSGPIEILIGADIAGKLFTGGKKILSSGLVAMETKLGWTLMGRIPIDHDTRDDFAMVVTSMFVKDATLSDLWNLDSLGITDPAEKLNKTELQAAVQQHFIETVTITEEGRYEVHLPWRENHPILPDNFALALKRTNSTVRKLKTEGFFNAYQQVLEEWVSEGVIEEVPPLDMQLPGHYLPHRHVVKLNSTTPVRPVFDASAREGKNPSLNQCLETGPNFIETIPSVLASFRLKRIGVVGDIRRAFLQISLNPSDRNYLRFLWTTEEGELKIYRHCRVVFGVSSSPFLLEACLKLHLETTLSCCEKGSLKWPIAFVKQLASSFYVDNCVTSLDDEEQAQEFINFATTVMRERQFELRGWELTGSVNDNSMPVNVLGLLWKQSADTLEINLESFLSLNVERVTKKVMLSAAHRIFDPIGLVCCVTLVPKLLLQQTWIQGIGWDEEVDADIKSQFLSWLKSVPCLKQIKIPRWLPGNNDQDSWTLHIFSDACQTSYAAAAFLRVEMEGCVRVQLVTAKARVSPISKTNKKMTIPRLELLAATIASRMYANIIEEFPMSKTETIFWTDATTVLAWINREEPWDIFVFNRVKEIRELTTNREWRHIPGYMNPADLPSRGCSAKKLLESRWWEGPAWLRESPNQWPQVEPKYDEHEINRGKKKNVVSSMVCGVEDKGWYYKYFSHYKKIVRLIGWILRFVKNCKTARSERVHQDLTTEEYKLAENKVVFLTQNEAFNGVVDSKLSNLLPFVDENGVIRLVTKISNRKDIEEFCHPAVLPNHEHPVVSRMIMDIHRNSCHAGVQMILPILREQFWILGGRQTVRSVLNSCLRCKRHIAKNSQVMPTPLPEDRVRNARVFEITGVDMAGPLYLKKEGKDCKKAWVCLFTCGVYRAVHLELVSSLSTDIFLLAFRRFINRRGRPHTMYSDQGTNFVGANNALSKLDWTAIENYSSVRKIVWKFNPPAAPWWGGWWERLIAIVKNLLRRVLGHACVDYEELQTILCDCEGIINSRPLTYVSQDPMDLTPLTPSMFLQDVKEVGVPDFDLMDATDLNRRFQYRNKLRQTLRERFRSEYLGQLQLLANKTKVRKISVGEIVLIGSDNQKRLEWPLGRITELVNGKDGHVRVVRVKTSVGELVRPIQRIYPLELHLGPENNSQTIGRRLREVAGGSNEGMEEAVKLMSSSKERTPVDSRPPVTRSGRIVQNPKRLDL